MARSGRVAVVAVTGCQPRPDREDIQASSGGGGDGRPRMTPRREDEDCIEILGDQLRPIREQPVDAEALPAVVEHHLRAVAVGRGIME